MGSSDVTGYDVNKDLSFLDMIFTEVEAEVNIIYIGTINPHNNRNESQ
jgi:hypothetical protein